MTTEHCIVTPYNTSNELHPCSWLSWGQLGALAQEVVFHNCCAPVFLKHLL